MHSTATPVELSFMAKLMMNMPPSSPKTKSMETRPYACPQPDCSQRFKRNFTLKEHLKTHTGEKTFTRPVKTCGKTFMTSGNLGRHKRLHPWLKPQAHFKSPPVIHACKVAGCGKRFSTTGNLTRHVKQRHLDELSSDGESKGIGRQVRSPCGVEENKMFSYPGTPGTTKVEAFRFDISSPDASQVFNPLIDQVSGVNDEELLETLQCLF